MTDLSNGAAEALRRIADADAGEGHLFRPMFVQQIDGPAMVDPSIDGHDALQAGAMFELDGAGLIRMQPKVAQDDEFGPFQLTAAGRTEAARRATPGGAGPALSSWDTLEPIRAAIYERWNAEGSPPFGLTLDDTTVAPGLTAEQLRVALGYLRDGGMIEYRDALGPQLPMGVRPSQKTIEEFGRWPTNDPTVLADRLLETLDAAIANATDPEDRSRLQKARDALGEVSKTAAGGMVVALGKYLTGI